ncbi:hypothetical protein ACKKBG_A36965 [Auxenochlorella protothecoides x Auxenochlorella symbiontica]
MSVLEDVVALVCCADAVRNARQAIQARLREHGARVVQRLSKDVSHVVFERKHVPPSAKRAEPDADLLELYTKLDKFALPPTVVTPLWVEHSAAKGRRLLEKKYIVARPKECLLAPSGTPRAASGSKRRRVSALLPRPPTTFDMDDSLLSSSQKMQQQAEGLTPARNPARRRRGPRLRAASPTEPGGGAAARALPALAGPSTQAVAAILACDLRGEAGDGGRLGPEQGRAGSASGSSSSDDDDFLDTPLSCRLARSAGGARHPGHWLSPASSDGSVGPVQRGAAPAAAHRGATRFAAGGRAAADPGPAPSPQRAAPGHATPVAATPAAPRFSVRQLVQHIDKPVLLLKSTPPFKTALPSPGPHSGRRSLLGGIPIPGVERLPSPQVPLPGACAPGSQGEGTAPTPPSTQPTPSQRAPSPGPRPSPWSAERPWDAPREGARSRRPVTKKARKTTGRVVRQEPAAGAQPCARRAGGAKLAAEVPVAEVLAGPRDPQPGLLALTSVEKDVAELARSATLRLRGIRLCSSGRGEAGATHLVVGRERRTIKLLLALANGAWLVTPQWITASLDAGEWLPVRQFPVGERFRAAAERSRSARERGAALLAGQRLYIHARTGSGTARPRKSDASLERREGGAASAADLGSLRRLAGALGAELTGPTECSLCILAGDAPRPATLPPAVPSVTSGWLLHAAEHHQVPPVETSWRVA